MSELRGTAATCKPRREASEEASLASTLDFWEEISFCCFSSLVWGTLLCQPEQANTPPSHLQLTHQVDPPLTADCLRIMPLLKQNLSEPPR